ncbi:MAG: hypothetical protein BGP01_08225 [Paludibacter sp. 47-17]|nr:MAG: hypothetical protein BGP01_08225 [Paludibacter sp. 47-17]
MPCTNIGLIAMYQRTANGVLPKAGLNGFDWTCARFNIGSSLELLYYIYAQPTNSNDTMILNHSDSVYFQFLNTVCWAKILFIGIIYKTAGFLPEELNLEKYLGLRLGTTLRL